MRTFPCKTVLATFTLFQTQAMALAVIYSSLLCIVFDLAMRKQRFVQNGIKQWKCVVTTKHDCGDCTGSELVQLAGASRACQGDSICITLWKCVAAIRAYCGDIIFVEVSWACPELSKCGSNYEQCNHLNECLQKKGWAWRVDQTPQPVPPKNKPPIWMADLLCRISVLA